MCSSDLGLVLLVELLAVQGSWKLAPNAATLRLSPIDAKVSNTVALGRVLYTDYVFLFQAAGAVLLVTMIGAIVLTLRDRQTSRHQSIRAQTERTPEQTLEMVPAALGAGVSAAEFRRPKAPEAADAHADDGHGHGGHGHGH